MTEKEAQRLKRDDRVKFSDGVKGTVVDQRFDCTRIQWDDDQVSAHANNKMQHITKI